MIKKLLVVVFVIIISYYNISKSNAVDLTVVSYNVLCGGKSNVCKSKYKKFGPWDKRRNLVINALKESQADLIGLQEVSSNQQAIDLKTGLIGYQMLGKKGDLIFFNNKKIKLLKENHVIYPKDWYGYERTRTMHWALFETIKDKSKFLFINTHLDHAPPGKEKIDPDGFSLRDKSVQYIAKIRSEVEQGISVPTILVGDFNADADTDEMEYLLNPKSHNENWNYPDGFMKFEKSLCIIDDIGCLQTTFNNSKSSRIIDHILVSGVTLISTELVASSDDITEGRYPSDHKAIVSKIKFD